MVFFLLSNYKTRDMISFSSNNRPTISIEDYIEEASTYEYHFEFNGENFIFKSFEKVNL